MTKGTTYTKEETKMKNAEARWPRTTTMEHLDEMRFGTSGAILRYADIECRLNLVEAATELFEDGGHAMAWCMKRI